MKTRLTVLVVATAVMLGTAACSNGSGSGSAGATSSRTAVTTSPMPPTSTTASPTTSATTPSSAVTVPTLSVPAPPAGTPAAVAWEALTGRNGEYMAEARYASVIAKFGAVEPYVSVKAAEGQHITALTRQLERFGVTVPGNPYLGQLQAPAGLEAAAEAAVTGETANVAMYDTLLGQTTDAVLTRVLTNLRGASSDVHLPLFRAAAENDGTLTKQQMIDLGLGGAH